MTNQPVFLGVDGGGTKTEAIISTKDGQIVGRGLAEGSNPHNGSISESISNVKKAITAANSANLQIQRACLGIAGLDTDADRETYQQAIRSEINTDALYVCNDGQIGFRSGSDNSFGICVIASTGSSVFGINSDNRQFKAGNWGYLLGDQGSGFSIGQAILKQSTKEFDGRAPTTNLLERVYHYFEVENFSEVAQIVYRDTSPVSRIAGLASILSEPEFAMHPALMRIATEAVNDLFLSFQTIFRRMEFQADISIPVVYVGKLFMAKHTIADPLTEKISNAYPSIQHMFPQKSPAEGALKIALTL